MKGAKPIILPPQSINNDANSQTGNYPSHARRHSDRHGGRRACTAHSINLRQGRCHHQRGSDNRQPRHDRRRRHGSLPHDERRQTAPGHSPVPPPRPPGEKPRRHAVSPAVGDGARHLQPDARQPPRRHSQHHGGRADALLLAAERQHRLRHPLRPHRRAAGR